MSDQLYTIEWMSNGGTIQITENVKRKDVEWYFTNSTTVYSCKLQENKSLTSDKE